VEIELIPEPDDRIAAVVAKALEVAGVKLAPVPVAYESAWRRAAFAEGVERDSDASSDAFEARSPRSFRAG
jgi:hypothetical protein